MPEFWGKDRNARCRKIFLHVRIRSFLYLDEKRPDKGRKARTRPEAPVLYENNQNILRFRNSTLNKGKHRCEEFSGIYQTMRTTIWHSRIRYLLFPHREDTLFNTSLIRFIMMFFSVDLPFLEHISRNTSCLVICGISHNYHFFNVYCIDHSLMESQGPSKASEDTLSEKLETSGFRQRNSVTSSIKGRTRPVSVLSRLWEDSCGTNNCSVTKWGFYDSNYTKSCFRSG